MKSKIIPSLLSLLLASLACQTLFPESATPRDGAVITTCTDLTQAVRSIQFIDPPQGLTETGVKQGGEFDPNEYFNILTNLSMQEGYALDYIYLADSLGAYPLLAARPIDQPPFASPEDLPADSRLADYWNYIEIKDTEQGYFEFVVMRIMAEQFYLFWHANYNDTEIVCDSEIVDAIVAERNTGNFGMKFDSEQMKLIRAMTNIEPLIKMADTTVTVEIVTFTKWGGFYRMTYTIDRNFPHEIMDVQEENIVPYDCGIMF